jgi:hypothetical protein
MRESVHDAALGELHLDHEQDMVVTCDMDAQSWQSCVTL